MLKEFVMIDKEYGSLLFPFLLLWWLAFSPGPPSFSVCNEKLGGPGDDSMKHCVY